MKRGIIQIIALAILIAGGWYLLHWYFDRDRIQRASEQYAALYHTQPPTEAPATDAPAPAWTDAPVVTPAPTAAWTEPPLPDVVDVARSTADADTLLYTLPPAPPVQESFQELLKVNPETIGYLEVEGYVSLPVVQRENDVEFYLDHDFEGQPAPEGALFLDGANRLVPEDDCLIVYGHNMKNGTMLGRLSRIVHSDVPLDLPFAFDTIYRNGLYAPFAVLTVSTDPESADWFDFRRPLLASQAEFDGFVSALRARAIRASSIPVRYGQKLLLLVTCEYQGQDDRLIIALVRTGPEG